MLETKYRDIADGNLNDIMCQPCFVTLETKYRDIADGNSPSIFEDSSCWKSWKPSTAK